MKKALEVASGFALWYKQASELDRWYQRVLGYLFVTILLAVLLGSIGIVGYALGYSIYTGALFDIVDNNTPADEWDIR